MVNNGFHTRYTASFVGTGWRTMVFPRKYNLLRPPYSRDFGFNDKTITIEYISSIQFASDGIV